MWILFLLYTIHLLTLNWELAQLIECDAEMEHMVIFQAENQFETNEKKKPKQIFKNLHDGHSFR